MQNADPIGCNCDLLWLIRGRRDLLSQISGECSDLKGVVYQFRDYDYAAELKYCDERAYKDFLSGDDTNSAAQVGAFSLSSLFLAVLICFANCQI